MNIASSRAAAPALSVIAAVALSLASAAPAAAPTTVVKAGRAHGRAVVVDRAGRTLYVLTPETRRHILCKGGCLSAWPPVRVSRTGALKAGRGVSGRVGRLDRGSFAQATLRGLPIYTYVGDAGPGQTSGDGLRSYGGTWHVVRPG